MRMIVIPSTNKRTVRTAATALVRISLPSMSPRRETVCLAEPLSAVLVEPETVRQPFNDTDADQLWLVVGAPPEPANTTEMTEETLAWIYPDGPKAMPPELASGS